jgi:hypothetical protein
MMVLNDHEDMANILVRFVLLLFLSAPARNYGDVFGTLKPPQSRTEFAGEAWRTGHRGWRA